MTPLAWLTRRVRRAGNARAALAARGGERGDHTPRYFSTRSFAPSGARRRSPRPARVESSSSRFHVGLLRAMKRSMSTAVATLLGTRSTVPAVAGTPGVQPIITPEAVVLDFERAGVASRTIAIAIDALALAIAMLGVLLIANLVLGDLGSGGGAAVVAIVASLGMVIVWFTAFETLWRGRTLGKAAMGLRVVSADGTTVRFQQAFLRAAVGIVDFLLVPVGFVAVGRGLFFPRDQRLGDLAAGTLVVRERSASTYVAPAWFQPPPGWEQYTAALDVSALDEGVYSLVRAYLLRTTELAANARDHMAVQLAKPVAVRIDHTPPAPAGVGYQGVPGGDWRPPPPPTRVRW